MIQIETISTAFYTASVARGDRMYKYRNHGVIKYRGSRRRLRYIKGRDDAYSIFWVFVIGAVAILASGLVAFLIP